MAQRRRPATPVLATNGQVTLVMGSRRGIGGLVWGLCLLVAGCGGAGKEHVADVRLSVSPAVSLEDQSVDVRATGLSPHEIVSLSVASTDAKGVRWISAATFLANGRGVVDTRRSAARSGAYTGVWPMGLIAMMSAIGPASAGAYFWADIHRYRFTVSVEAQGKTVASSSFLRHFSSQPLMHRRQSLSASGLIGDFDYATGSQRRPAILLLGGSEGGIPSPLQANLLAAQGYPVLALAYFKEPGLPQELENIPLEYFAGALTWLGRQPQVDPTHIVVLGISRGSEAALLSGAYFPTLVHAVIAMVPSDVAICSYPGCQGPAWTLYGHALPYTRQFDNPHPTDQPAAVIPVQRIRGPIFLACGTNDQTWTSCPYADAIMAHLNAAHDRFPHVLYSYAHAGHYVGTLVPYEPQIAAGGADQVDQEALEADWPRVLNFLAAFSRSH